MTATEVAVETIGITDGQGSDATVTREASLAGIAYGVRGRHVVNLQNGGLEGGNGSEGEGMRVEG